MAAQVFLYRGRDEQGTEVRGTLKANSPDAAAQQLQSQRIVPVAIQVQKETERPSAKSGLFTRKTVPVEELIMLCRQMRALTRAGVPIIQAIAGLADLSKSDLLRMALEDVNVRLATGSSLANALGAHPNLFNNMFVSLVNVGENTGRLEDAFGKLIAHLEMERDTRNRMMQAIRYPCFVIAAMVLAMGVVNVLVIPQFSKVFAKLGADLPLPTQILMAVSHFTVEYGWLLLLLAAAGAFGFFRYINSEKGRLWWDQRKLKLPIIGGILERIALSRFARSFAMTFESGVPVLQALSVVGPTVSNEYIAGKLNDIRRSVERGDSLARSSAAAGIFSELVVQMITIGEETGSLDKLLHDVADFYDEEVDYDLKGLADAIEPIVLIFLGVLVLVLALGVFLPMWELGSAMTNK